MKGAFSVVADFATTLIGCRTVVDQVACGIILPPDHLIRRIVVTVLAQCTVGPDVGAIACQVVGVAVGSSWLFDGLCQPLESIVGIRRRTRLEC